MLWSASALIEDSSPWHAHEVFEFILCAESAAGLLELPHQSIAFQPGRSILIPPGLRHRYVFQPGERAGIKLVCMTQQDVATFLSPAQAALLQGQVLLEVSFADHGARRAELALLSQLIRDGFGISDSSELPVIWGAIGLLLALHVRANALPGAPNWQRYRAKIDQVRDWLETQLEQPLMLDRVAEHFGLSRSLLTREFRRHTGKSLIDYCNHRRLEKAAVLLASSQGSIAQSALDCGFANLSHFHRQFKSVYGLTPAAFRLKVAPPAMAPGPG
jgi:AraC-like DNA-binding protein